MTSMHVPPSAGLPFARQAGKLFMALAALTLSGLAGAQAYPTKNVTLLVPFAAGSSTDIMTRLVAKGLNERLKTLIAAYKTLGSSFTGTLSVMPS